MPYDEMVPGSLLCGNHSPHDVSGNARHYPVGHRPTGRIHCVVDGHVLARIVGCRESARCSLASAPSTIAGIRLECAAQSQAVGMVVQSEARQLGEAGNGNRGVGLLSTVVATAGLLAVWLNKGGEPHPRRSRSSNL